MRQPFRTAEGGLVDRDTPVRFDFDGHRFEGCAGDSLASALLANGVRLVGRSFKYHRPRGIVGLGAEEPNALVRVGTGDRREPNVKATQVELYEGLVAESQNRWPTLAFDAGAVADRLSAVLPAGFYYKTFMRPAGWWMRYERWIRRMAGLGIAPADPDPDRYAKRHAHCEVLVVGGGPAGLSAALAAAATGARVILADEGTRFGGGLLHAPAEIDGAPALEWVEAAVSALAALDNVTLLPRSTVAGAYDHGLFTIAERVTDHLAAPPDHLPRQRLWMVRARRVVLAAGAIERPLVFADNDRPGVMLASAVRGYLHRYGVLCGRRAVLFTDNDTAYPLAIELAAAGAEVAAIVDLRERLEGNHGGAAGEAARAAGIPILGNRAVGRVRTRRSVTGVDVRRVRAEGKALSTIADQFGCDLVAMSGGWNPTLHLFSQARGRTRFDDALAAFVPDGTADGMLAVGACAGAPDLDRALADGAAAGRAAAEAGSHRAEASFAVPRGGPQPDPRPAGPPRALPTAGRAKRFVDFQNDVTADDVALAAREGYRSIEHVKRYTTLGMGTDQGKLGNPTGAALLAHALGRPIGETTTTTNRPPYTPVTIGALAAGALDEAGHPVRRTAVDDWHAGRHTVFVPAGLWRRPLYYPVAGRSPVATVDAEALAVRDGVGLVDVSTLGKLDIKGPDAAELLDRLYVNGWKTLAVGRARYGVMLRDDGRVFDDGVTMRLGEHHFLMTTTTARAEAVFEHIEFLLQTTWRDLRVYVTPVTEHWFACAVAGPRARALLFDLTDEIDVSDEGFPMMSVREARIAGIAARVLRISYSGELSYELHAPADYGLCLWNATLAAGGRYGLTVYGADAMATLRIEKGHITHAEADGRTTPDDLGLGRMVSRRKDFVGRRALDLPALAEPGRLQLVGLVALDPATPIPDGAQIVPEPWKDRPQTALGHVTSHCRSPTLGTDIALALLRDGRARHDTELWAVSPVAGTGARCRVTSPVFYDPEGTRADG